MKSTTQLLVFLALAALVVLSSCQKDDDDKKSSLVGTAAYNNDVALRWNNFFLDIERYTPGYRPPVAGRAAGYIGLIAYESVLPGMTDRYNSIAARWVDLPSININEGYHWPTSLNAAYSRAYTLFFPTAPSKQLFDLYKLEEEINKEFASTVPADVIERSKAFGRQVADEIYEWSATDTEGHRAYNRNTDPNYQPPQGIGKWQPTYPNYAPALLPHWGKVRSFVADESDVCPPPLEYQEGLSSPLYQQAKEVATTVTRIKGGELYEDRWIADFWSDDCPILTFTPAGRWIAVANQVVEAENAPLSLAVETYARIGMGLCDAGIRCWGEKYRYNIERPIDYIRRVMGENQWNTIMCPDGSGRYFTPPFPAYPSGHATFGAVAAEIMADLYGDTYAMTDRCHKDRNEFLGQPRSFKSFYEMAEENAYSRIPIGVHYRQDLESGVALGYGIGKKVNALAWRK